MDLEKKDIIDEILQVKNIYERIRLCEEILDKDPNNKYIEMLLYALLDEVQIFGIYF